VKDYARIARKITAVLFLVQSLSSAGFIALFTVNTLVGVELTGQRALAGGANAVVLKPVMVTILEGALKKAGVL